MKDTEEQSDEDVHRARPERVPRAGVSVSGELGGVTLLVYGCVHQSRSSLNPILLGVCGSFFTLHDQLLTPFLGWLWLGGIIVGDGYFNGALNSAHRVGCVDSAELAVFHSNDN